MSMVTGMIPPQEILFNLIFQNVSKTMAQQINKVWIFCLRMYLIGMADGNLCLPMVPGAAEKAAQTAVTAQN